MAKPQRSRARILRFLGGAGTVSGSRFLIETGDTRVLIDCGLFQGLKDLRLRNWERFPVAPDTIDAVVLTHAHLDHCGYLPALYKGGFRGRVLCTPGTHELCKVILADSAFIQERDAEFANKHGFSKHDPALPLYGQEHAARVLELFETVPFHQAHTVADGVEIEFYFAGHILGSSIVSVELDDAVGNRKNSRLVFSGDLGRPDHPLLRSPDPPPDADVLVIESTYGNRTREDEAVIDRFVDVISRTIGNGGIVLIPAFAVDRTEVLLRLLEQLVRAGRIPEIPIYVDSPMALAALKSYRLAIQEGWDEIRPELHGKEQPFSAGQLVEVRDVEASKQLTASDDPAIVISASGMATGGRVLHHLAARLPDPRNCVILAGFQAAGTRGRRLLEGARTIKLLGRYIPVRAEVVNLTALSVHADRDELIAWAGSAPHKPEMSFVVHGEPDASESLREALETHLDYPAVVPKQQERIRFD
jgi:metallo-beta-lactamase family protein